MKCPHCSSETRHSSTSVTLVGFPSFEDREGRVHHHDDNCEKRGYRCKTCGWAWIESIIRHCAVEGCEWTGKKTCFCHKDVKVKKWTDPEDYYTPEVQALIRR